MSVQMMAAVMKCGPQDRTPYCVLLSLANYADDMGFCFPQISTIAADSRCDYKTTTRQIAELEAGGWLYVARKVLNGKSNIYILNLSKLGVTVPVDAKKNPVFMRLLKTSPGAMTPIFAPEKSTGTGGFITDNPQPPQRASEPTQRANEAGSTGIACPSNRYNHQVKNHQEPSGEVETPLPPRGGANDPPEGLPDETDEGLPWSGFKRGLKLDLAAQPNARNFVPIEDGVHDYDFAFRDWWYLGLTLRGGELVFHTTAADPERTRLGVARYRRRIEKLLGEYFPIPPAIAVRFEFKPLSPQQSNAA